RARPGHVPDRTADKALDHVGVARKRAVELGDDLGRRALLRTVDRGRSFGAEERIAYVAGDLDRRPHQPRVGLPVDTREARERGAALRKLVPFGVKKAVADRASHTRAPVVRRAS